MIANRTAAGVLTGLACALMQTGCGGGGMGYGGSYSAMMPAGSTTTPYAKSELVANTAGSMALTVDTNLVNPWGLSIPGGTTDPAWVANNATWASTLYDGKGVAQPATGPLAVSLPPNAAGTEFGPTGIVYNARASDFVVSAGGAAAAASFLYDGEAGLIAGWSPGVNKTQAITAYADAGGAVYKGLAIAMNGGNQYLYATDFHNAKVDVFDVHFAKQASTAAAFTFSDPAIPPGFAPFGIQALNSGANGATQIFVTYAQQAAPANQDNLSGAGLGFVDVYDTNGQLIKQLIARGPLNAPWGLALAPADFGTFSNALLVGNFGDGWVNAFDPQSGMFLGTLSDAQMTPIATPGLWGIAFGNDAAHQPHNTLFFVAGTNNQTGGLYGRIDLGAMAPPGY